MNELIWVGNTLYPRWLVILVVIIIVVFIVGMLAVFARLANKSSRNEVLPSTRVKVPMPPVKPTKGRRRKTIRKRK